MPYEYERDEWRAATRSMTELQRVAACGDRHDYTRAGVCRHCGDDEPRKDAHA